MEILKDLQHGIETVNNVRENHRKVPEENHLSLLADGVAMLAWVTIKPNPSNYIAEVLGGAQFYGNKILTLNKDKYVAAMGRVQKTHLTSTGILPIINGSDPSSSSPGHYRPMSRRTLPRD